ncbi:MAG: hypothetical protein HOP16_10535 [Acidobacteria bacterium]|nr:hypothetical protein [Acidobacteriota bacterium]
MNTVEQLAILLLRRCMSDLVRCEVRDRNRITGARHLPRARLLCRSSLLLTGALLAGFTSQAGATEREQKVKALTMSLSHNVSVARSDVTVKARVEPDARSRELIIEWVADDLSGGSHTVMLEGDRAAASHRYTLKHLSPGAYSVTALLRRNDGTVTKTTSTLLVVGVGEVVELGGRMMQGSAGGVLRPANQP